MADLAQQLEGLAVEIDTDALWAVQENDIAALLRTAKGEITALRTQLACAKVACKNCRDAIRALSPTPHQEKKE